MHTVLIEDERTFYALKEDWLDLLDRAVWDSVFISPAWVYCWWRAFRAGKELRVWSLWGEDDRLLGLCPLYRERKAGIRRLAPLGLPLHADMFSILADKEFAFAIHESFFSWLGGHGGWDVARLANVPLASLPAAFSGSGDADGLSGKNLWEGLARKAGLRSLVFASEACLTVPLGNNPDSVEALLSRNGRNSFKRLKNKIAREFAEVEVRREEPRPEQVDDLVRLSTTRTKAYGEGKSFFTSAHSERFIRELVASQDPSLPLLLLSLYLDKKLAAYEFLYVWRDSLLLYFLSFDQAYAVYSPGLYLLCQAIDSSLNNNDIVEFNLLLGEEDYKKRFSVQKIEQMTCLVFNRTPAGLGLRTYLAARRKAKELFRRYCKKNAT